MIVLIGSHARERGKEEHYGVTHGPVGRCVTSQNCADRRGGEVQEYTWKYAHGHDDEEQQQ